MYRYYDVLGVGRSADDAAIKRAYHGVSRRVHPDKPGGSTEAFQELDRAFRTLSDVKKRQQYDRIGLDLNEREAEGLDVQISAIGFKVTQAAVGALARTALGGMFVCLLPQYGFLQWCHGVLGVGMVGVGLALDKSKLEAKRIRPGNVSIGEQFLSSATVLGGRLLVVLAVGWVSYQTNVGRQMRLPWLYEAGVLFAASGGMEERCRKMSDVALRVRFLGAFCAARCLGTRPGRWWAVLVLEGVTSILAPFICSAIGSEAAVFADRKFEKYAQAVASVVEAEASQKRRLQLRVDELETTLADTRSLETTLANTRLKLDRYVAYAEKARGIVDRHVAHKARLQSRIDELEALATRSK